MSAMLSTQGSAEGGWSRAVAAAAPALGRLWARTPREHRRALLLGVRAALAAQRPADGRSNSGAAGSDADNDGTVHATVEELQRLAAHAAPEWAAALAPLGSHASYAGAIILVLHALAEAEEDDNDRERSGQPSAPGDGAGQELGGELADAVWATSWRIAQVRAYQNVTESVAVVEHNAAAAIALCRAHLTACARILLSEAPSPERESRVRSIRPHIAAILPQLQAARETLEATVPASTLQLIKLVEGARAADPSLGARCETHASSPSTDAKAALAACRTALERLVAFDASDEAVAAVHVLALIWPDETTRKALTNVLVSMHEKKSNAAVAELARVWPDPATRTSLVEIAMSNMAGAKQAVTELARQWPDDATRALLAGFVQAQNVFTAEAAVIALARGWPDGATRSLLEQTAKDGSGAADAAVRELARAWPDPATRAFLEERVQRDQSGTEAALTELVRRWPDAATHARLLSLAKGTMWVSQSSVRELVRRWPQDDTTRDMLVEVAESTTAAGSRLATTELSRLWPGQARDLLTRIVERDGNNSTTALNELCRLWPDGTTRALLVRAAKSLKQSAGAAAGHLTRLYVDDNVRADLVDVVRSHRVGADAAVYELCRVWPDAATRELCQGILKDQELPGKRAAVNELGRLWPDDGARAVLAEAARSGVVGADIAVQELCRRWPDTATKEILLDVIKREDNPGRPAAVAALRHVWPDRTTKAAIAAALAADTGVVANDGSALPNPAAARVLRCTCTEADLGGFQDAAENYGEGGRGDFSNNVVSSQAERRACGRLYAAAPTALVAHVEGEVALCAAAAAAAAAALAGTYLRRGDEGDHRWFAFSAPLIVGEAPFAPATEAAAALRGMSVHAACSGALDPALAFQATALDTEIARLETGDDDNDDEDEEETRRATVAAWRAASDALHAAGLSRLTYLCPKETGTGSVYPHFIVGVTARGSLAGAAGLTVWT